MSNREKKVPALYQTEFTVRFSHTHEILWVERNTFYAKTQLQLLYVFVYRYLLIPLFTLTQLTIRQKGLCSVVQNKRSFYTVRD